MSKPSFLPPLLTQHHARLRHSQAQLFTHRVRLPRVPVFTAANSRLSCIHVTLNMFSIQECSSDATTSQGVSSSASFQVFLVLIVFRDAGDVASHKQERTTSAGASMAAKEGCQNSSTSLQFKREEENQRVQTSHPQKNSSKSFDLPSFRPCDIHKKQRGSHRNEREPGTKCSKLSPACRPGLTLNEGTEASEHLLLPSWHSEHSERGEPSDSELPHASLISWHKRSIEKVAA